MLKCKEIKAGSILQYRNNDGEHFIALILQRIKKTKNGVSVKIMWLDQAMYGRIDNKVIFNEAELLDWTLLC